MAKKKKAGKAKKKKGGTVKAELPPEPSTLTLLYRKASFDVLEQPMQGSLRIQYDKVTPS